MTNEKYMLTIITAGEGHYLTQSSEEVELMDRIVSTKVALSKFSTSSDWKEITEEEGKSIIEAQIQERKKMEEESENKELAQGE